MSSTRLRSPVVLLAVVACRGGDDAPGAGEGGRAGVPASFIRIEGAGHGFEGADLERANAAIVRWFERHLGTAVK